MSVRANVFGLKSRYWLSADNYRVETLGNLAVPDNYG